MALLSKYPETQPLFPFPLPKPQSCRHHLVWTTAVAQHVLLFFHSCPSKIHPTHSRACPSLLRTFQALPNTHSLAKPTRISRIWPLSISSASPPSLPPHPPAHTHTMPLSSNTMTLFCLKDFVPSFPTRLSPSRHSGLPSNVPSSEKPSQTLQQKQPPVSQSHCALPSSSQPLPAPDMPHALPWSVFIACLPFYNTRVTHRPTGFLTREFLAWHPLGTQ